MSSPRVEFVQAVRQDDLAGARQLVDAGVDQVLMRLKDGGDLLSDTAEANQMNMFQFLIDNGAPINGDTFDAFSDVCRIGNVDAIQRMISAGALLNVERDGDLLSVPLRTAVSYRQLEVVKTLVESGAAVNGLWNNRTNLSLAVSKGYSEIADFLRSKGALMPAELVRSKIGIDPRSLRDETIEQFSLHFGFPNADAQHSLLPTETPIAVHVIPSNPNCPDITLFTNGLADRPMTTPAGKEEWSRAELFMQLPKDWKIDQVDDPAWGWPFQWLREIAQLPARNNTWFGGKVCIIDLGELTPGLRFRGCFMHDQHFYQSKTMPGSIVTLYRVIPLTNNEIEFERKHGTENLLVAMELIDVPPIVDMNRADAAT